MDGPEGGVISFGLPGTNQPSPRKSSKRKADQQDDNRVGKKKGSEPRHRSGKSGTDDSGKHGRGYNSCLAGVDYNSCPVGVESLGDHSSKRPKVENTGSGAVNGKVDPAGCVPCCTRSESYNGNVAPQMVPC